jgi:hypothetical protein
MPKSNETMHPNVGVGNMHILRTLAFSDRAEAQLLVYFVDGAFLLHLINFPKRRVGN